MTKYCSDYFKPEKEGYLPNLCCISCHEDADDYGYMLSCAPDDEDSEVCCAVRIALEKLKAEKSVGDSLADSKTENQG